MVDMDKEIWKEIEGSDGYFISNYGNIQRKDGGEPNVRPSAEGYLRCNVGGLVRRDWIHRFVARAFCENQDPENKTMVDHIDGNKQNNRADNLRWVTSGENTRYAAERGVFKYIPIKTPIIAVNVKTEEVRFYDTQAGLCKDENLDDGSVNKVVKGIRKTTHNWIVRYFNKDNIEQLFKDGYINKKDLDKYIKILENNADNIKSKE